MADGPISAHNDNNNVSASPTNWQLTIRISFFGCKNLRGEKVWPQREKKNAHRSFGEFRKVEEILTKPETVKMGALVFCAPPHIYMPSVAGGGSGGNNSSTAHKLIGATERTKQMDLFPISQPFDAMPAWRGWSVKRCTVVSGATPER